MTARTCEACEHLRGHVTDCATGAGTSLLCDFDGVAVPCNESGVCGRWSAREGEEEE